MLTGRCACGDCSYEIDGDPVVVVHCHCLDCQRISGAGHTTGAMFPEARIRLIGEPAIYVTTSSLGNTVTRLFCGNCGSPLFGKNTGMLGFMTVSLGTVDASDASGALSPQVAIFARSRRLWDQMDASLPTFDVQPGWTPTDPV